MGPLLKYILLQVPGWLLLGVLLWWAESQNWIYLNTAIWIMVAWLAKDAVLYPMCRLAFEGHQPRETDKLIGAEAQVVKPLQPEGMVRINGELWRARAQDDGRIDEGGVRVIGADGLLLIVRPRDSAVDFDLFSE